MTQWFNGTGVKLLNCADFQNTEPWKLKTKRCALVLFFADWCGHCQDFKPEYVKFADCAQFVRVYAVNTDKNSELMNRMNNSAAPMQVKGYPTIWLYKDGQPIKEYSGARSFQGLLKAAKKLCNEKCKCDKRAMLKHKKL
jgi:thiol-disulfide isomerase/thioredoxin